MTTANWYFCSKDSSHNLGTGINGPAVNLRGPLIESNEGGAGMNSGWYSVKVYHYFEEFEAGRQMKTACGLELEQAEYQAHNFSPSDTNELPRLCPKCKKKTTHSYRLD